ncbi:E4 34K [Equine adenovirus 1]|uniref:E4 34K n=1 Tax=Equine adenovirus A serotype 1 TaxID=46916 RepID=G5CZ97_ADEE1|nr:early E4 protein [Equine adenovirus 1]AEP16427.1 early E4 protein [Equine adenovirus 1]ANG08577.1 E4 34K [Equine adenovirus 1]
MEPGATGDNRGDHITSVVRADKSLNGFALCYEIPIPWSFILSRHEQILLGEHTRAPGVELLVGDHCCVSEPQRWQVRCRCGDPMSLSCLAGKKVLTDIIRKFLEGAAFNRNQLWYREYVNEGHPDSVQYVGSIFYRGTHFIYLLLDSYYVILDLFLEAVGRCFNPDMGVFVKGFYNYWIILKCCSCPNYAFPCFGTCAVRVRRLVDAMLAELDKIPGVFVHRTTSRAERRRQRCLRQGIQYGRCIDVRRLVHRLWLT